MIEKVLQFLANPTFFAGFSIVIGVAYVAVWVISLKEMVQPDAGYLEPAKPREGQFDFEEFTRQKPQPQHGQHIRRDSVRVHRKQFGPQQQQSSRRRRATRAA